ncbi:retention module-containing protein, partial [Halomonas getboli]|uniref:retention module-containing protein n=1 Tax=Halomonas getboli TaxID=2935862 RepID=UPI001FFEF201
MIIATVVSITGQAWARDAEGHLRELRVGDTLQEGETLVTSDNGRAVLDFGDNLDPTVIAGGEEVVMTLELASDHSVASEEASAQDGDIEALLTAIDEGQGDLLETLDATAAGGAGGAGGGDSGHSFVRLLRISESVSPLAFNYGLNAFEGPNQVDFDPAVVPVEEEANDIPTVDTQDLNDDGDVVWESALTDGSGGGSLTTSGAFQIDTGVDALDLIEVQDASGAWIAIAANGTEVQGTYGTLTVNTDGSWSYTLGDNTLDHDGVDQTGAADQVQDQFGVRVTDDDGDVSDPATLTIDVNDDGPVAVDDSVTDTVPEDGSIDIDVFANDTAGADGVDLQNGIVVSSDPAKGSVIYNGDGTFTYQANAGAEGADSFSYTITDADGDTDTATVNLTIAEDSTPQVVTLGLRAEGNMVWESALSDGSGGGTTTISGTPEINTGNDQLALIEVKDVNGDWIAIDSDGTVVQGTYGTVTVDTDGSWQYVLTDNTLDHDDPTRTGAGDQVQELFDVRFTDDDGDVSDPATLTIDVNDDGPVAVDDSVTDEVAEDGSVEIGVFANDTAGADGVDLQTGITVTTDPSKGTVTYNGDGTFTYQANAGAEGDDSFSYTVTDADGDTSTATVSLSIAEDSTPTVTVADASVDETGGLSSDTQSFTTSYGNDSAGTLSLSATGATWDAASNTLTADNGDWQIVVNGDGTYTVTQLQVMTHPDGSDPNDPITVNVTASITDNEGDPATDAFTVTFLDDGPVAA